MKQMKQIQVRFEGKCSICSRRVTVGETALYYSSPRVRILICHSCSRDGAGAATRSWMLKHLAEASMLIARAADLLDDKQVRFAFSSTREKLLQGASIIEKTMERIHEITDDELVASIDNFIMNLERVIAPAGDILEFARRRGLVQS